MKQKLFILLSACLPMFAWGQSEKQETFLREITSLGDTSLPYTLVHGKKNVQGETFSIANLLTEAPPRVRRTGPNESLKALEDGWFFSKDISSEGVGLLSTYRFTIENEGYATGKIEVYGRARMSLFIDGKCVASQKELASQDSVPQLFASLKLRPGGHNVYLKTLHLTGDSLSPKFKVVLKTDSTTATSGLSFNEKLLKPLSLDYMMSGSSLQGVRLSPSGRYALVTYAARRGLKTDYSARLYTKDGKLIRESKELVSARWMPKSDRLYMIRTQGKERVLFSQKPDGSDEQILVDPLPEGAIRFSPDEQVIYLQEEAKAAPKDDKVQRMQDPDDRMPGWRNRPYWKRLDLNSGTTMPLTFGSSYVALMDIHPVSGKLLIQGATKDWTEQPYSFSSLYEFDPITGKTDTLFTKEIDIASVSYIPNDDQHLLILGSPNAFDGVGSTLPKGRWANSYEREAFLFRKSDKRAICLTMQFDPTIEQIQFDYKGDVILQATDGALQKLYTLNIKRKEITPIILSEDQVSQYSLPKEKGDLWYFGQSAANADKLYRVHNGKETLVWDLDAEKMKGFIRPEVHNFTYTTPEGTPIEGWYYLPPHFDANKKYPLLVYYYGGTIASKKRMEGTYSPAMYAAQGYVVYILNPSGCTGYGQEFAARHLNAWGEPTATEIIEAVRSLCAQNSFINAEKIGCFGASYGGFMTQYLQTRTDLFAAAVSHAGISSITNYWGSGYWGMGYSTVASAHSYPWSHRSTFVDQSPLFNAEKIHTPLLLLHGDSDTNVPTAESINMYNALKVLGREVELITFTGEDHFILEPERRIRWTESIFAWFARWLKDEPTWWNDLYGAKEEDQ
ncbi:S9 family peptidase [Porphyromonas circumdentaria]|uniref:Dipeptidyl aminopeptidase/acylaminoacyl peptidase n=1 Tax=Porphyromonas circumdentaria TaxID=29524 RepID=A0A1T4PPV3_9PORP|nr:prolyl oligopeptidase family serine peptidase [Porphyromonas circumdentaria]MBB6276449.1 dipeptidyl aminopeptidase/acylaminoacyl peptidase [Porphyromonas circumdentaria]MDO4722933.1 prolyl oligopeptidase family serine peptidase [Porphyromonas circumdentaria]SJZ93553.1 Dipeptidyl aminopeptidase/acylaminoacyl peptidase [Porphyromonas circumdentaria]